MAFRYRYPGTIQSDGIGGFCVFDPDYAAAGWYIVTTSKGVPLDVLGDQSTIYYRLTLAGANVSYNIHTGVSGDGKYYRDMDAEMAAGISNMKLHHVQAACLDTIGITKNINQFAAGNSTAGFASSGYTATKITNTNAVVSGSLLPNAELDNYNNPDDPNIPDNTSLTSSGTVSFTYGPNTSNPFSGVRDFSVTVASASGAYNIDLAFDAIPVQRGAKYYLAAPYRYSGADSGGTGIFYALTSWYDASNALISTDSSITAQHAGTTWAVMSGLVTAPSNAVTAIVTLRLQTLPAASGVYYWDLTFFDLALTGAMIDPSTAVTVASLTTNSFSESASSSLPLMNVTNGGSGSAAQFAGAGASNAALVASNSGGGRGLQVSAGGAAITGGLATDSNAVSGNETVGGTFTATGKVTGHNGLAIDGATATLNGVAIDTSGNATPPAGATYDGVDVSTLHAAPYTSTELQPSRYKSINSGGSTSWSNSTLTDTVVTGCTFTVAKHATITQRLEVYWYVEAQIAYPSASDGGHMSIYSDDGAGTVQDESGRFNLRAPAGKYPMTLFADIPIVAGSGNYTISLRGAVYNTGSTISVAVGTDSNTNTRYKAELTRQ